MYQPELGGIQQLQGDQWHFVILLKGKVETKEQVLFAY